MDNVVPSSKGSQGIVTAKSSSLSKRSAPTVPPASAVFEPLVKSILARRFVHDVLSISVAVSWPSAAVWTWWQRGGIGSLGIFGGILNWISPLTLFSAVLWWSLACLPSAVLRKLYLQGESVLRWLRITFSFLRLCSSHVFSIPLTPPNINSARCRTSLPVRLGGQPSIFNMLDGISRHDIPNR